MTLRIVRPAPSPLAEVQQPSPDSWTSRIAKLIPGEALTLYGASLSIIPDERSEILWIMVGVCSVLSGALRYLATRSAGKGPQIAAMAIAVGSFLLWVAALPPPAGPLDLGSNSFLAALAALVWATVIPIFYKGD